MFEEPEETPEDRPIDPVVRAQERFDAFRMHAEFCAVFEGTRKFEAELKPKLGPEIARDLQRTIGRLEKSRAADSPLLPEPSAIEAAGVLDLPKTRSLSTNDYHIHRRPGEVMIVRWLEGEQVESYSSGCRPTSTPR